MACLYFRRALHFGWIALAIISIILLASSHVHGQYFKTLYNFKGPCCATYPWALTQGRDTNLYGMVVAGGDFSLGGSIYRMTPSGAITVLHNFDTIEIQQPSGPLTLGPDGNLYGLTRGGGLGLGTFFKMAPDGTLTILHSFTGGQDGLWPYGSLVLGRDGNFYGTAVAASNPVLYSIFKVTPDGTVTTFSLLDVNHAPGSLVFGKDGNLYGVSGQGREVNGSIFKVTSSGKWRDLHVLDGTHGAYPTSLVAGPGTNFFGTTAAGGSNGDGTVFMVTPQGVLTVLHNFDHTNIADGNYPLGLTLANDGNFYGVTLFGGLLGYGEIFQVTRTGKFLVVHNFNKVNGSGPVALMQYSSGRMYGATQQGGIYNLGILFWFDWGFKPFVELDTQSGPVGSSVGMVGNNFLTASGVTFNGVAASYAVDQDGYLIATVPNGATTGYVQVTTSSGTVTSKTVYTVR